MTFFGVDRSQGEPVQIDMEAFLRQLCVDADHSRSRGFGPATRFAPFRLRKAKSRNRHLPPEKVVQERDR